MINLGQMLEETCVAYGDRTFIIHDKIRMTYNEFNAAVNALANHLKSAGIQKDDKIAIMLPNCPEFMISYFGAQKVGAVAVTLNVLSTPYELRHFLGNSDARIFITLENLAKRFEEIREEIPLCRHVITTGGMDGDSAFTQILKTCSQAFETPGSIEGNDAAAMIYTSGLTGKPLGAVLTHRNLLSQSELLRWLFGGNHSDRGMAVIPLFHSFGGVSNMLAVIRVGASVVLMERFNLDVIFNTIEKEKITYTAAVPRLYLGMFFHPNAEKYDISSLRFCVTGGAPMPPDFIPQFREKFGAALLEGYGLTEASPVCSVTRLELPLKPGSIGTPIPEMEALVVDDTGKVLPVDTEGELVVKGDNVMKGYYKNEEATNAVIKDGWLHTGDLAKIDSDGYIFLTGRKKRMIITSGFNVYPKEVETVLEMHQAVQAARVSGKEDLMRGEIVRAEIVAKQGATPDEKDIMRHCRVYLSSYKLPREIEFVERLEA